MRRISICLLLVVSLVFCLSGCKDTPADTTATASFETIKIADVKAKFDSLSTIGVAADVFPSTMLSDGNWEDYVIVNTNHIQGISVYGDYTIFTVNGLNTKTLIGYVFIANADGVVQIIETPPLYDEKGIQVDQTHTGGIQIVGDYLVVGSDGTKNIVLIYDLYPLLNGGEATLYQKIDVTNKFDGGAVGAGSYKNANGDDVVVLIDNRHRMMWAKWPTSADARPEWNYYTKSTASAALPPNMSNSIMLLTDTENKLWIIDTYSPMRGSADYDDFLYLYSVEFLDDSTYKTVSEGNAKQVTPFDVSLAVLGSHFRFTGCVKINDDNTFTLICSPSTPLNLYEGAFEFILPLNEYRPAN